jgi:hypothetical protein
MGILECESGDGWSPRDPALAAAMISPGVVALREAGVEADWVLWLVRVGRRSEEIEVKEKL